MPGAIRRVKGALIIWITDDWRRTYENNKIDEY